jgi:hypothetical protein
VRYVFVFAFLLAGAACSSNSRAESTTPPTPTSAAIASAPPATSAGVDARESDNPVAGACAHATGRVGTIALRTLDYVPQPRCLIVKHDQFLRVVNGLNVTVRARLGTQLQMVLKPGRDATFPRSIGNYLAPGVHTLHFTSASGAAIWVDAVCAPSGAPCSSPTATP